MFYWFTASSKEAQIHYDKTIVNKVEYKNIEEFLTSEQKLMINSEDLNYWGAVAGKSNKKRWENLKIGDTILGYQNGSFVCRAKIKYKFINKDFARKVWGEDNNHNTWELIYVLENLEFINVSKKDFISLMGYKESFIPQGFSNPKQSVIEEIVKRYGKIENFIDKLAMIPTVENDEKYEDEILGVEEKICNNLNITEEDTMPKKPKKFSHKHKKQEIISRDTSVIAKALKRSNYKCDIDRNHLSFISNKTKEQYTEGHHIIPFSQYNLFSVKYDISIDHISNIASLCPNCHKKIHYGKKNEVDEMLEILLIKFSEDLKKANIVIDLPDLKKCY